MKAALWYLIAFLPKIAFAVIVVATALCISERRTERMLNEMLTETLAKQYADVSGYSLPTQAIPPRKGTAPSLDKEPVAEARPENGDNDAIRLLATSAADTTVKELLESKASLGVKATCYAKHSPGELTAEWTADTSYCVRVDMPRVMFQNLERNSVDVVYPENVKAGEEGVIVIRVKNKGSGAEYVARATFTATDDLRIVYGSSDPEVASGGELDYGSIGDGKSLVVNFFTGATEQHYKTHGGNNGWSGGFGYVDANFYRVRPSSTID